MSNIQLSAGDRITSNCTKCKDITNHTIVAMVGEIIAKVECSTCGGVHNYRNAVAKKPAVKRKTGAAKPVKTKKIEAEWSELLKDQDPNTATPYNMQMIIESGHLIQHPNFGLGRVISVTKPNKMEVHFSTGIKLLRCVIA
jgi:hypothetical protein